MAHLQEKQGNAFERVGCDDLAERVAKVYSTHLPGATAAAAVPATAATASAASTAVTTSGAASTRISPTAAAAIAASTAPHAAATTIAATTIASANATRPQPSISRCHQYDNSSKLKLRHARYGNARVTICDVGQHLFG